MPLHNLCRACRQEFSNTALFDAHRVGKHAYATAVAEDGRRCISADEMEAKNWTKDDRGVWTDPEGAKRVRAAFAGKGS